MRKKVNFNVLEKNKDANIADIKKSIKTIVDRLLINEFMKNINKAIYFYIIYLYKMNSLPIGG